MINLSIYYKKNPLWISLGGFLFTTGIIMFFNTLILLGILWIILGSFFIYSNHFPYISFYHHHLIVRGRRFIPWNKKINYEDIEFVEIVGDHIKIYLKQSKTFKLYKQWIDEKGIDQLRHMFSDKGIRMR